MKLISILLVIFLFPLLACAQEDFEAKRMEMVKKQIIDRGINDGPTIRAMRKVPRQDFVPEAYRSQAYRDSPLSIGYCLSNPSVTINFPLFFPGITFISSFPRTFVPTPRSESVSVIVA